ncbi:MAG: J domain-containing protein [Pseudomonadota bacterium]
MFDKVAAKQPKREVAVSVALAGGERFDGSVYLKYDERITDLLNDGRAFIPIKQETGDVAIVAKTNILSLQERRVSGSGTEGANGSLASGSNANKIDQNPEQTETKLDDSESEHSRRESSFTDFSGKAQNHTTEDKSSSKTYTDDELKEKENQSFKEENIDNTSSNHTSGKTLGDDDDKGADTDNEKTQKDLEAARRNKKRTDLYRVLRISPGASLEEIRTAYKARMKAIHPDTLIGKDINEEKKQAALQATQLVNRAYRAILSEQERIGQQDDEPTDNAAG